MSLARVPIWCPVGWGCLSFASLSPAHFVQRTVASCCATDSLVGPSRPLNFCSSSPRALFSWHLPASPSPRPAFSPLALAQVSPLAALALPAFTCLCPRQTGSPVRAGALSAAFPADARSLGRLAWRRWWMSVCGVTALCERGLTNLSLEAGSYPAGKGAWAPRFTHGSFFVFFFFSFEKKKSGKDLSALGVGKIRIHVHCCKTLKIFPVTLIAWSVFYIESYLLIRFLFWKKSILVIKTRLCIL